MKLPRYSSSALPQDRNISPEMAGATASAWGQVAQQAAGTVADAFDVVGRVRDASDMAAFADKSTDIQLQQKAAIESENWNLPEINGRPTGEVMREELAKRRRDSYDALTGIRNKSTRQEAKTKLDQFWVGQEIEFESRATKHSIDKASADYDNAIQKSLDVGDYEGARSKFAEAVSLGLASPDKQNKVSDLIHRSEQEGTAQSISKKVDDAYAVSEAAGDAAFAELLDAEISDPRVKELAVNFAEARRTERKKAIADAESQANLDTMLLFGDAQIAAAKGSLSGDRVDAMYSSGQLGKGEVAISRRNQLKMEAFRAQERALAAKKVEIDISQGGVPLPNTAEARKGLDFFYKKSVEGITDPKQLMDITRTIIRDAQMVPETVQQQIDVLGRTEGGLAAAVQWYALTQFDGMKPEMKEVSPVVADAYAMYMNGVPVAEATKSAWQNRNAGETEKTVWKNTWEADKAGTKAMEKSYTDMFKGRLIGSSGTAYEDAESNPLMQQQYNAIFKSTYDATGNFEAAARQAQSAIQKTWVRTNINGKWEVQQYGIPGDVKTIGNDLRTKVRDSGAQYLTNDGKPVNFDDVRFVPSDQVIDGKQVMRVMVGEQPLMMIGDDGKIKAAAIGVTPNQVREATVVGPQKAELEKRLKEIESARTQEETLYRARQSSRFSTGPNPEAEAKYRERVAGFDSAERETKKQLEKVQRHPMMYPGAHF